MGGGSAKFLPPQEKSIPRGEGKAVPRPLLLEGKERGKNRQGGAKLCEFAGAGGFVLGGGGARLLPKAATFLATKH